MRRRVCVVVPARNEAGRIVSLLKMLKSWVRRPAIVVVANGCTDNTAKLARSMGARVLEFTEPLGHDVGRAIGMAAVDADVYVVVDADIACRPVELEPFVRAVERGVDLALNRYPLVTAKAYRHPTSITKRTLNLFLDRPDLRAASLTAVPHAISRRAVNALGYDAYCVPPVAQAKAVLAGLRVEAVAHVPVGMRNPLREPKHRIAMRDLILGDCLEAMHTIIEDRGPRGGFTDLGRQRELLAELPLPAQTVDVPLATLAVVPVKNESRFIHRVVTGLRAGVGDVCVISNGSNDGTPDLARSVGARVQEFTDALGHDVGRAVGCLSYPANRYLFADGDFIIARRDLLPFARANAAIDVALNEFDKVVPPEKQRDPVSVVKRFLNISCGRSDLGAASLTAVPHAIGRRVIDHIGAASLAVPPVAQVKAVLAGFRVEAVHPVDVVKPNRIRVTLHHASRGKLMERLILGDHLEAVACLLETRGVRGGYHDTARKRNMVAQWVKQEGHSKAATSP